MCTAARAKYLSFGSIYPQHIIKLLFPHPILQSKSGIQGQKLILLPPYSPELNPIEHMWSKLKNYLRKVSAREPKEFKKTIKVAYQNIQTSDLGGWFQHCGYVDQ